MDACSLRQDQQLGRARWWRSRLRSETGRSEQGRYILRHSAVGGLTGGAIKAAEKLKVEWSDAKPPFPGQAATGGFIRPPGGHSASAERWTSTVPSVRRSPEPGDLAVSDS